MPRTIRVTNAVILKQLPILCHTESAANSVSHTNVWNSVTIKGLPILAPLRPNMGPVFYISMLPKFLS